MNLTKLLEEIVHQESKHLKGRILWCASTCSEALIFPDDQTLKLKTFILDNLLELLDLSNKEVMYLPIEAFQTFSRVNQETVSKMAPKITPKLLVIFKTEHSEGNLGQELINLFKLWCQYDDCRDIFINTFIPFIMEIIDSYYNSTPNEDHNDSILQLCNVSESLSSLDSSNEKQRPTTEQKVLSVVDSTIL